MSRTQLPLVNGKQAVRALQRLGFVKVRQVGSHVSMRRKTTQGTDTCTVPMLNSIPRPTLDSVLQQAHVTREEFIAALKG